jgi:hypothetical protein
MKTPSTVGLRQRIEFAKTSEEIKTLLDEGEQYEAVSKTTHNSWATTARKRLQALNN